MVIIWSQEDFTKQIREAMQALASLYFSWSSNYYNWFMTKNSLADDVWSGGGSRGDNAQMEQLNEYTFRHGSSMIASFVFGHVQHHLQSKPDYRPDWNRIRM